MDHPQEDMHFGVGATAPAARKFTTSAASKELDAIFMRNPFVKRKLNRERRARDKAQYVMQYVPEATTMQGTVVDVGCADGLFLEYARAAGNAVVGIDASTGEGGMGDDYLAAAALLSDRQGITVFRTGFNEFVHAMCADVREESCVVFNFQGSWAMLHWELGYIIGEPHDQHQDTKQLAFAMCEGLTRQWGAWFTWMRSRLCEDGVIMMLFNETQNQREMVDALDQVAIEVGFTVERADSTLVRKYRKTQSADHEQEPSDVQLEHDVSDAACDDEATGQVDHSADGSDVQLPD